MPTACVALAGRVAAEYGAVPVVYTEPSLATSQSPVPPRSRVRRRESPTIGLDAGTRRHRARVAEVEDAAVGAASQ